MITNHIEDILREAQVKPSLHRLAVAECVYQSDGHPDADTIYRAVAARYPGTSRTTVYNALHLLADKGVLNEIATDTAARYDSAVKAPHSHFFCRQCGGIFDIPQATVTPAADIAADGYVAERVEVTFKGLCPKCKTPITDK